MRWTKPNIGDRRHVASFLLFPKLIGNEMRWLEWARWTEYYRCIDQSGSIWFNEVWEAESWDWSDSRGRTDAESRVGR